MRGHRSVSLENKIVCEAQGMKEEIESKATENMTTEIRRQEERSDRGEGKNKRAKEGRMRWKTQRRTVVTERDGVKEKLHHNHRKHRHKRRVENRLVHM